MAGGWPLGGEVCNGTDQGTNLAIADGTVITASTVNTKGSWVQLVASSAIDACWIVVACDGEYTYDASGNPTFGIDIGIGPSGSEQVIIANLTNTGFSTAVTQCSDVRWAFPCQIASGTRIAARMASSNSSADELAIQVTLFDGGWNVMEGSSGFVDTYGFVSGSTIGTAIDPGGTANTKGSYSQLTASTSYDLLGFILGYDTQAQTTGSTSTFQVLLDIAVGAGGSEIVILPNIPLTICKSTTRLFNISPWKTAFLPIAIPAGTRIAARAQASVNTATARVFGLTLYGVRA